MSSAEDFSPRSSESVMVEFDQELELSQTSYAVARTSIHASSLRSTGRESQPYSVAASNRQCSRRSSNVVSVSPEPSGSSVEIKRCSISTSEMAEEGGSGTCIYM